MRTLPSPEIVRSLAAGAEVWVSDVVGLGVGIGCWACEEKAMVALAAAAATDLKKVLISDFTTLNTFIIVL
jgi:hypothetical protein